MTRRPLLILPFLISLALTTILSAQTQPAADSVDALQKSAPKVYIDCSFCDQEYIRTEIAFMNYVRDRKQADVHVMVTQMYTGSGGTEFTLTLIGQQAFDGVNDTLRYNANKTDTPDMTRFLLPKVP